MTYNVTTWADGYGNWHASVPLSDPTTETRQARAAIRAELRARDAIGNGYRLKIRRECVTNHGTAIYRETPA